ncbi:MAG: hypothetical protein JEZ04_21075 [Spirochaetales bacterium]|nr:hypothetical protein [Spirochaetales bacterium]
MKPGDLFIEKYRFGELTEKERRDLEKNYPDSEALEERIQELEASDELILGKYPPEKIAAEIQARSAISDAGKTGNTNIRKFRLIKYTAFAAAAALVLAFGLSLYTPATNTGGMIEASEEISAERIKGLKPSLKIYRRTGESAEILGNRDTALESDLIQIEYIAGSFKYGVIFSIDGRGMLTMHYPTYEGIAAELDQAGAILLPYAYELDDAPDFERFFFITGGSSFNIDEVLDAAYELASRGRVSRREFLALPDTYYQTTILLKKGAQR